jgi:hypothetical protein
MGYIFPVVGLDGTGIVVGKTGRTEDECREKVGVSVVAAARGSAIALVVAPAAICKFALRHAVVAVSGVVRLFALGVGSACAGRLRGAKPPVAVMVVRHGYGKQHDQCRGANERYGERAFHGSLLTAKVGILCDIGA